LELIGAARLVYEIVDNLKRNRERMIVFVTTHGHGYTLDALVRGTFGRELPPIRVLTYERLFRSARLRRATYVFTDIERLYPWEQRLAAGLYRRAKQVGLHCLNDPARVMSRYELLRTLHATGINPFSAYRAEDRPRPARFPVFIRYEADHLLPLGGLIPTQHALDCALEDLPASGVSLRGLLVIEFCAEPIGPDAWRKYGTFRIGEAMHLDHAVVEDRWLVKYGKKGIATPEMFLAERDAVATNEKAELLRPAFECGGIEFGRADHATVKGREVVYEINTNPHIDSFTKQSTPVRDETLALARNRMAQLLWNVDSGDGRPLRDQPFKLPKTWRSFRSLVSRFGLIRPRGRP
jgi:hypothetical protein